MTTRTRCEELDEFGQRCLLVAGPHITDGCLFPLPNVPDPICDCGDGCDNGRCMT